MLSWVHGFPDRDQQLPPPGSTASLDGVMVPLTTPEHFLIGSSNSIPPEQQPHQQQPDGEPQPDQGGGRRDKLEQFHLEQEVASSWVDLSAPNSQIAGVPAPGLQLPDSEFGSMPVSSNPHPTPHAFPAEDPDDQSGAPIAPAGLPAMLPQTSQEDFNQFLAVSDKCGLPRNACAIVWPRVGAQPSPRAIARIIERNRANTDHQFIDRHNIRHN